MRNNQDQEKEKVVIPPPPSAYTQTIRMMKECKVR